MAQLLLNLADTQAPDDKPSLFGDLVSSHPDAAERARMLKEGTAQAC